MTPPNIAALVTDEIVDNGVKIRTYTLAPQSIPNSTAWTFNGEKYPSYAAAHTARERHITRAIIEAALQAKPAENSAGADAAKQPFKDGAGASEGASPSAPAGTALDDKALREILAEEMDATPGYGGYAHEIRSGRAVSGTLNISMVISAMRRVAASAENIQQNIDGQIDGAFRDGYRAASADHTYILAEYNRAAATAYIPDIPRSPVRTKEWREGNKDGFSVGLAAGMEILRNILKSAPQAPSHARGE